MKRIAFKMQLNKGAEAEYKKRHDELWPELQQLLKSKKPFIPERPFNFKYYF